MDEVQRRRRCGLERNTRQTRAWNCVVLCAGAGRTRGRDNVEIRGWGTNGCGEEGGVLDVAGEGEMEWVPVLRVNGGVGW